MRSSCENSIAEDEWVHAGLVSITVGFIRAVKCVWAAGAVTVEPPATRLRLNLFTAAFNRFYAQLSWRSMGFQVNLGSYCSSRWVWEGTLPGTAVRSAGGTYFFYVSFHVETFIANPVGPW